MAWDLSCLDWEDRIRAGRSLVPPLPLDWAEADRAVTIFNGLQLPDVPGLPYLCDACGEWFIDIVRALFGSLTPVGRQVREIFLLVPKKNSKTSYGAALMLTAMLMNKRPRAEYLVIAPTKIVADLAFGQAIGMIEANEYLKEHFRVQEHIRQITDNRPDGPGAQLKIKSFDAGVLTGVKPSGILIDELHEVARDPAAARIVGQLRGGLLPNQEAFALFITTQSDEVPVGVFRTELMAARAIRDGRAGGAMLPILYEFPDEIVKSGAWRDPENWSMVNPNRGRSLTIERLMEDWSKAQLAGEGECRRFASQHCNVEIGMALRSDRWGGADFWEACGDPTLTLEAIIARSAVLVAGIDDGGLDTFMGVAVIGRETDTGRWLHWGRAWAHPIALERHKADASRWQDFAGQGDLVICQRIGDDIAAVADVVEQIEASGKLADKNAIGVNVVGLGEILEELVARGIARERIVGVPSGWKLTGAINATERRLAEGSLVHGARPFMAWTLSNAKVEPSGGGVSISKAASGSAKIDALIALLNAAACMVLSPTVDSLSLSRSIEEHGLLFV